MPAQLYLVSPARIEAPEALAGQLARLCADHPVAAFRLELPQADTDTLRAMAAVLFPAVQAAGTAAIIAGAAELAAATGADGVHLDDPARVAAARRTLGPDTSIGVACGQVRHDAMVAAEAGADYVEFGPFGADNPQAADPGLLTWWQELMELPCVAGGAAGGEAGGAAGGAAGGGTDAAGAAALVAAGADFIAIGGSFWNLDAGAQADMLARTAAACELPFAPGA